MTSNISRTRWLAGLAVAGVVIALGQLIGRTAPIDSRLAKAETPVQADAQPPSDADNPPADSSRPAESVTPPEPMLWREYDVRDLAGEADYREPVATTQVDADGNVYQAWPTVPVKPKELHDAVFQFCGSVRANEYDYGQFAVQIKRGRLIVRQTAAGHEELARLLDQLRHPPKPGVKFDWPGDPAMAELLARRILEVRCHAVSFERALKSLGDLVNTQIDADWPAFEAVGITKATEISLQLRDVTLAAAIHAVLTKAAGQEGRLDYTVRGGRIFVSTVEALSGQKELIVYNVKALAEALARVVGGGPLHVYEAGNSLVETIRNLVLPDSWAPTGDGQILKVNDLLVVRQTSNGHREVCQLLNMLANPPSPAGQERATLFLNPLPGNRTPEDPVAQQLRQGMSAIVPEIRLRAVGFENALNFLRDLQRINITPNWAAMEAIGITRGTEISLQLRDVTFETALNALLVKAAGREDALDYLSREGQIKVSTTEDLACLKYVRVYNIHDLLDWLGDFSDRPVDILMNCVRTCVQPDSWAPTGDASVLLLADLLLVKQTAQGHRLLSQFLMMLRNHPRPGQTESRVLDQPAPPPDKDPEHVKKPLLLYNVRDLLSAEWPGDPVVPGQWRGCRVGSVTDMLRCLILPDTWAPTGDSNIMELDGLLIVKQTAAGHRDLAAFLTDLRAALARRGRGELIGETRPADANPATSSLPLGGGLGRGASGAGDGPAHGSSVPSGGPQSPDDPPIAVPLLGRVTMANAVRYLAVLTRCQVRVDWNVLASAGQVGRKDVVDFPQGDLTAGQLVRRLLDAASPKQGQALGFSIHDGVIEIGGCPTAPAAAAAPEPAEVVEPREIRILDVSDVLNRLAAALPAAVAAAPAWARGDEEGYDEGDWRDQAVQQLVTYIRRTVSPDTWAPTGDANLLEYCGVLIVKQTEANQREVAQVLTRVRSAGIGEVLKAADPGRPIEESAPPPAPSGGGLF